MRRSLLLLLVSSLVLPAGAAEPERPPIVYLPYENVPTIDPTGRGVLLPYEQFITLWDAAHPRQPPAEVVPPTGASLTGYTITGAVRGDAAELSLEGTIAALAKGWSSIVLPGNLGVTAFTCPDPQVVLERRSDGLAVHLPKAGTYRFNATVAVPVVRDAAGRRGLALSLPAAGAGRLDLQLPDADADVAVQPAIAFTTEPAAGGKRLRAVLGGAAGIALSWQPAAEPVTGEALVLSDSMVRITVAERSVRVATQTKAAILRRPVTELTWLVPADSQVLSVDAPSLRTWERQGDRVVLHFHEPVSGDATMRIDIERLIAALNPGATRQEIVGIPQLVGAARSTGQLLLGTGEGLSATAESAEGMGQVDPASVVDATGADAAQSWSAAYRFAVAPPPMTIAVTRLEPELRVTIDQLVKLGSDADQVVVCLGLEVRKAGVFALPLTVPAAWELAEVSGVTTDEVRRGAVHDGLVTLDLAMRNRFLGSGSATLRFRAPPSIPRQGSATLAARVALVPGARLVRGTMTLAAPRSWALSSDARSGLSNLDGTNRDAARTTLLADLGADEDAALAFAIIAADASVTISAAPRPRELVLRQEELVSVGDGRLARAITWRGEVRYNALTALQITAPTSLDGSLTFKGANLAEHTAVSRAEGTTTWELRFAAPVLGPFTVSVEETRQLPALSAGVPTPVVVDPISVGGATRYQAVLAVAREGSIEVNATVPGADSLPTADLPAGLVGAAVVAGFQGAAAPSANLVLTRHDLVAMPDAAVIEAVYHAVIGDDGKARVRGDVQLMTRGRPWLGVSLPTGADLLEAAVDGRQARVIRRADGSVAVPLDGSPGLRRIALVYELAARDGRLGWWSTCSVAVPQLGASEASTAGAATDLRPLPVAGSGVALYLPERFQATRWQGDFEVQWTGRLGTPSEDLTVRVPLVGNRHDLTRLGDGGTITVALVHRHLIDALVVLAAAIGLTLAWALRRRLRLLTGLTAAAVALTVLLAQPWSLVSGTLAVVQVIGVLVTGIAAWWRQRAIQAKSDGGLTPDPWLEKSP